MSEITEPPAEYGDTDNTLLLKMAGIVQGGGGALVDGLSLESGGDLLLEDGTPLVLES